MNIDGHSGLLYLVEADQGAGQRLQIFLEAAGFRVEWFEDAPSALSVFAGEVEDRPYLVLLRAELPDVSGFLVCDRLKHDPEWEDVPVVVLYSDGEAAELREHEKSETRADAYVFVDEHDTLLSQFRELQGAYESVEILLTSAKSAMPLQPLPSLQELPPLEPLPPLSSSTWAPPPSNQFVVSSSALLPSTQGTLLEPGLDPEGPLGLPQASVGGLGVDFEVVDKTDGAGTPLPPSPETDAGAPLNGDSSHVVPASLSREFDSVDDFMNLQQQLKSSELELVNWKTRYLQLEERFDDASTDLLALGDLKRAVQELEQQLDQVCEEKEATEAQVQELQETLARQEEELSAVRKERDAASLEQELFRDPEGAARQAEAALEEEREKVAELEARLLSLLEDDEVTATHTHSEETGEVLVLGEHTLLGLEEEAILFLREREVELTSLRESLETAREEAARAEEALEQWKDAQQQEDSTEEAQRQEELDSARQELELLRSTNATLEEELEVLQESRALLLQELESAHETQEIDARTRLEAALLELEATKKELEDVLRTQSEALEDEEDDVTVNVLDEEKQQLRERNAQLNTELAERTIDLKELQHALSLREAELEQFRSPVKEENPGLNATEVALLNNAHEAEVEKLELLLAQYKQSNKELTGEKTELLLSVNELRRENEELESSYQSLHKAQEGFEKRKAGYDEQLTRLSLLEEEKKTLERQLRNAQSELASFEREVEGLQQDLTSVSEERNRYRDEVLEVQNELVANREEIDKLRDMETELHKQVAHSQRSFDSLQALVEQKSSSSDGSREEREALEEELVSLRKQNATLEQDLFDAVDKLQALQRHAGKASSALEDEESLRARQETRLQEMLEQAKRYEQELENRAEKLTSLRKENETLEQQRDEAVQERSAAKEEREQLQLRIDQLLEEGELSESQWEQKLKTQQVRFEREISDLEDKVDEVTTKLKYADDQKEHEMSQRLQTVELQWDNEKDRLLQEQMAQEMAWEDEKKEMLDTQVSLENSWSEERERLRGELRLREEEWNRKLDMVNKKHERSLKLQAEDFLEQIAIQEAMQREEREDLQAQFEEGVLQEKTLLFARHQAEVEELRAELEKAQRHQKDSLERERRRLQEEFSQREVLFRETLEARELELSQELNLERESLKQQLSMSQEALFEDFREREQENDLTVETLRRELEEARREAREARAGNEGWASKRQELESRLEDMETLRKHDRESLRAKYRSAAQTIESLEKKVLHLEQQHRESSLKEKELQDKLVQKQAQYDKLQGKVRSIMSTIDE